MSEIFFVVGISTDIGKTFLVEKICQNLVQKKMPVNAIKPIASGFNDDDKNSDSAKILTALNLEFSKKNLDQITPWRFSQSASPHKAAETHGVKINFLAVKKFCQQKIISAKNLHQTLLIESAGGLMTPINQKKTFLDLAQELKVPVLLVSANYLGSISHTLCAVEALKSKKILVEKIIVNENLPMFQKNSLISCEEFVETIFGFTKIETISFEDFFKKPIEI